MQDLVMAPHPMPLISIHPRCQMVEKAGPTSIGSNQIAEIVAPADNEHGLILYTLYTQVIQTGSPGNTAQSLFVAAATAPTSFASKGNCLPIYRTFQNDKQEPISLAGYGPINVINAHIPANWGIWQIVNVAGATLDRNNMRLGLVLLNEDESREGWLRGFQR